MEYMIVSNVAEKTALFIEDDMTIGEVRAIVRLMLDAPDNVELTMTLNGRQLRNDDEKWRVVAPRQLTAVSPMSTAPPRKLYCNVTNRPKLEDGSAEALRAVIPGREQTLEEERAERARARQMEPIIDAMTRNPQMVAAMIASQPGLKKMMDENPDVARQMKDPETLKMMMMSQLDPDRRREMNRNAELALSRISDYPGGQQLFERYMASFLRDQENHTERTEADLHQTSEDLAKPDPTKDRNSSVLPNPWQGGVQRQRLGGMPLMGGGSGMGLPGGLNPFMGGGFPGTAAGQPATDSAMMQRMLAVMTLPPQQQPPQSAPMEPSHAASLAVSAGYSMQLGVLRSMGFEDEALCLEALSACGGDVEAAVDYIADKQDE